MTRRPTAASAPDARVIAQTVTTTPEPCYRHSGPGYPRGLKVWIDIETPPQVRYLLPCKAVFERAGADVVVTARDDGATFRLLESEHVDFHAIGRQPGGSRRQKVAGLFRRAGALAAFA